MRFIKLRVKSGIYLFLLLHLGDRNLSLFSSLNVWIRQNKPSEECSVSFPSSYEQARFQYLRSIRYLTIILRNRAEYRAH